MMDWFKKSLAVLLLALPFSLYAGGGGGGCGPSNSCSGASSLTEGTTYSWSNGGCDTDADCDGCFSCDPSGGGGCDVCYPPSHNEDCACEQMGAVLQISGNLCGSPENTSWGEFCPTQSGDYDFSVLSPSCTGGAEALQWGIYDAGITCATTDNGSMQYCDGTTTGNQTVTRTLTAGQCYLIVFDGNCASVCSWDFLITGPPLPVKLASISADLEDDQKTVNISWRTSQESNGKEFTIIRKYDDMQAPPGLTRDQQLNRLVTKEIGKMPTKNIEEGASYFFTDHEVDAPGLYYYYLFELDLDGTNRALGKTEIYVAGPEESVLLNVLPQADDVWQFDYDLKAESQVELSIYDMDGRKVLKNPAAMEAPGFGTRNVDLSSLPKGLYMYQLKINGKAFAGKLMLQ